MAEIQTSYSETVAPGFPGMVANGETSNRISRTCEDATGIGFGKAAFRGTNDHDCSKVQTLTGSSAALGTNTGNGTMGAITVSAGAMPGVYTLTVVEPGSDVGSFVVADPNGNQIGDGVVASAFSAGGLAFTLADGATDFVAGDSFAITVAGGVFLGITMAHQGEAILSGQDADEYQRYANVGILTGGAIYVEAGETVVAGGPVFVDTDGNFVDSSGIPCPGWVFDEGGVDGDIVIIAKR